MGEPGTGHNSNAEQRITRVETAVESLASHVDRGLEHLTGQVARVSDDVSRLAEYARSKSQPNWGVLIAAFGAIVTLVATLAAGYIGFPLSHLYTRVNTLEDSTASAFTRNNQALRQEINLRYKLLDEELADRELPIRESVNSIVDLKVSDARTQERLQSLESYLYSGTKWRGGRPVPDPEAR